MDYKKMIIAMLSSISNEKILRLIYGFVRAGYNEERNTEKGGVA